MTDELLNDPASYDYELPEDLIAQEPLSRGQSRLLVFGENDYIDRQVRDLPDLLAPGDLLVVNDTRVIPARLQGRRCDIPDGGRVEVLLVEAQAQPNRWSVMAKPSRRLRPGVRIEFGQGELHAEVAGRDESLVLLDFDRPVLDHVDQLGEMPLPPYIQRSAHPSDKERYQTVFASDPGAIAAPTAGLHFNEELLRRLSDAGVERAHVTLHVGLGTFRPVTVDRLENHQMHSERYVVPEETVEAVRRAKRVIAIGTTVVRALESAAVSGELRAGSGSTELFIVPGFKFRAVDMLLTNFHLPRSTLLMMVSAFTGHQRIMEGYLEAVRRRYRFYSYGDAMLLSRQR